MLKFLIRNNKKEFTIGIVCLFLFALNRPLMSSLIIVNMDMAKGKIPYNINKILILNFLYLVYYFFSNLFSEKYLDRFMVKSKDLLNKELIKNTIFNNPSMWYEKKSDLINIFTTDISTITSNYLQGLIQIIYLIVSFFSAAILVYKISIELLIYLLFISILTLFVQRIIIRSLSYKQDNLNKMIARFTKKIIEINQNIFAIKTYGLTNKFIKDFEYLSKTSTDMEFDLLYNEDKTEVINQFSATLIEVGLYTVGMILIINNKLEVSALLGLVVSSSAITLPIYTFSRVISKFVKTKKVRERIDNILENKNEVEKKMCKEISAIRLKDLSLKYGEKSLNRPINFVISEKEKILIKGENGIGKSTLIKTILNLHDQYDGEIIINGSCNLKQINEDSYWEHISYMSQDTELFNDTLKNNIILSSEYDETKYKKLKTLLRLNDLADDIEISENQGNLSGGQKQKILLARSLYKGAPFLFLDEPFRNIDKESLESIYSYLLAYPGCLVIIDHSLRDETRFDKLLKINPF